MKTIGMIGGLSWHSTAQYYRLINQQVQERLGGMSSAKIVLVSLNFEELRGAPSRDRKIALLEGAVTGLKLAGADFFVVCANTTHSHFSHFARPLELPLLHIAEVVFEEATARGLRKLGLLATRATVQAELYPAIGKRYGVEIVPLPSEQVELVDRIIQRELVSGQLTEASRAALEATVQQMRSAGAEAVILGCTELQMFFGDAIGGLPALDSLKLHVDRVVATALDT
jgi:aspartate racemase